MGVGAGGLQEGTLWAQGWHGLGTWWMNQGTVAMALETLLVNMATCPWRYIRKASDLHLPMILMVLLGTWAWCRVMAPPERKEWEPISCAWNPRRWNPILRAVARRWKNMFDPVTYF